MPEGHRPTKPDASDVLTDLIDKPLRTLHQEKPNRIISVGPRDAIVITDSAPAPVPVKKVQAAIDLLWADGQLRIDKDIVGYRSAFIGAVLRTLPDVEVVSTSPRIVRLRPRP